MAIQNYERSDPAQEKLVIPIICVLNLHTVLIILPLFFAPFGPQFGFCFEKQPFSVI